MSVKLIKNKQCNGIRKMRKIIVSLFLLSFVIFNSVISPVNVSAYVIDGNELVNSLEVLREIGFKDEWDAASYVISKYWLQSTIDNKQEIIDYFDNRQWEDGVWGEHDDSRAKMAMAVLYAYFLLDAKPKKSLDSFFSQYDTWEEVLPYRPGHERGAKYHLVLAWACYYLRYPPWMTELFSFFEQNLDWTTSTRVHERSHILYCYLIAGRPYPNLDGIIEATLTQQYADGSWRDPAVEALAETAVQLKLLKEIMLLYPNHPRLSEMQDAINKATPLFEDNYKITVVNGKRCGYFTELTTGTPRYDLFFLMLGILGSVLSGTTQGDADPLFQSLCSRILDPEEIINYLDYNLKRGKEIGLLSFAFTIDSYELLGMETPNKTQVIEYLNSIQSDEGTWATGQNHYVPITAQILMFYSRSGIKPAKSLEPFFSTIDTWEEVVNHVQTYDPGNIWGGLWGYVASYVVYKGESPPWTNEFLNAVNDNFDMWAYFNHQRTHVIGSLLTLSEPIPRIDEVIWITLQQQKEDGSWDYSEEETAGTIQILRLIENLSTVDENPNPGPYPKPKLLSKKTFGDYKNLIDSAIDRGLEFVEKCYKTVEFEGKTYAGFATNPSKEYPEPMATAFGIWALLNPESDVWVRWFARVYARFEYFPEKPIVNEQIAFNASASCSLGGNVTSYEWNFDDGNTTEVAEPIINHTYGQPGNYSVTLKVTDDNNLWDTTTKTVTVYSERIYTFNVSCHGLNYTIIAVSNSTVTNFNFNYSLKQISFNVSGSPATMGYVNISIPKTFMWCDSPSQWNVTVDLSPVKDLTVAEDTHTCLFFTYNHSTYEVVIEAVNVVSEFPSAVILLSIMIIILLGVVFVKKRLPID